VRCPAGAAQIVLRDALHSEMHRRGLVYFGGW